MHIKVGPIDFWLEYPPESSRSTPLIHWWNKYTAHHGLACATTPGHTLAELRDKTTIMVAGVDFQFHRTARVPDNQQVQDLPPVRIFTCMIFLVNRDQWSPGLRLLSSFPSFPVCRSLA